MNPFLYVLKIFRSFACAARGIILAFRVDHSFRLELIIGAPIFVILSYILRPMSSVETILLWGSYFLILLAELLNTAIERLLERLHPDEHELIGASKDIAAAAVLVAFLLAGFVAATFLLSRFGSATDVFLEVS